MTLYAGEVARITTTGQDWDGSVLTNLNTTSAWVEIWDLAANIIVPRTNLTWSATLSEWFFTWDTTGMSPETFIARLVLVPASDGLSSWEFQTIRLRINPVPL